MDNFSDLAFIIFFVIVIMWGILMIIMTLVNHIKWTRKQKRKDNV